MEASKAAKADAPVAPGVEFKELEEKGKKLKDKAEK